MNGQTMKKVYEQLKEEGCGCWHTAIVRVRRHWLCIVMGWHDGDRPEIACKIGALHEKSALYCDFDMDFPMPWATDDMVAAVRAQEGDVYDTLETLDADEWLDEDWDNLYQRMNATAWRAAKWWQEGEHNEEI